ncbi:MAG: hypothetical protein L0211_20125 [Planctomycetaceae bacterium]|nr:hypothetical protein [Planctomycetaceae bacterium]
MTSSSPPPAAANWHTVHCMAGAVAALAGLVAVVNAVYVGQDLGTDGWRAGAMALCLAAAAYLAASSLDHWLRGRWHDLPPRAEPWLSILILVLGWFVLARGPSSRMLLAGLGPTIAALAAAAGISLLVHVRERLVLARPATAIARAWPLAAWRCALAAAVLLGAAMLESRPLPTVKPWEDTLMPSPESAWHRTSARRTSMR